MADGHPFNPGDRVWINPRVAKATVVGTFWEEDEPFVMTLPDQENCVGEPGVGELRADAVEPISAVDQLSEVVEVDG